MARATAEKDAPRGRGRPRNPRPASAKRTPAHKLTDPQLLARAIASTFIPASAFGPRRPITDAEFARDVLHCNPRTLYKYLNEGRALPALAREKLVEIVTPA